MAKPAFSTAWAASMRIYDPSGSLKHVADTIGGYVAININNPDDKTGWRNTCAVRMSYILNESGVAVPRRAGETVSGADGRQYFYRVKDVIQFLRQSWGAPDQIQYPPAGGGALAGKKGVILFEIAGWDDAAGHATLWNGTTCYDECYFNEPGVNYRTDRANFWSLP